MNKCFKPCVHAPFNVISPSQVVFPDYSRLVGSRRQPLFVRSCFWLKHFLKRIST